MFPVFVRVITRHLFQWISHFPVFKILLQTEVIASIMASPRALTDAVVMLSTPAEFPIFSVLTVASFSSRMTGRCFYLVYVGSQVLMETHCTNYRSV